MQVKMYIEILRFMCEQEISLLTIFFSYEASFVRFLTFTDVYFDNNNSYVMHFYNVFDVGNYVLTDLVSRLFLHLQQTLFIQNKYFSQSLIFLSLHFVLYVK